MQFGTGYYNSFDRKYDIVGDLAPNPDIEQPILPPAITTAELGQTVGEGGRQGTLIQSATAAIRAGAGNLELSTSMGGGQEPYVGAEAYGREARAALREMAEANKVQLVSVHTPTQIGNLSGLTQEGFNDQYRLQGIDEVKKAVNFASDVNRGGAIVIHTGEFQRPISDQKWAKRPDGTFEFVGYQEEPGRAIYYLVDDRNGRIIDTVRKSQEVYEPVYVTAKDRDLIGKRDPKTGHIFEPGDYIDLNDNWINETDPDALFNRVPKWDPEKTRFETVKRTWDDFEKKADQWNKKHPDQIRTSEEMFYITQMENQMLNYRGASLYHATRYKEVKDVWERSKKALEYYKKLEEATSEEEKWQLKRSMQTHGDLGGLVPPEIKYPTEWLKEQIQEMEHHMRHTHESSASADAQADTIRDSIKHIKPVEKYALEQSMKSYAESGIYAMQKTEADKLKKPIFIAPENIWPEMGYGAHPEELIELVSNARKEMVKYLTSPKIPDPHGIRDRDTGELIIKPNPWYRPGMTKEQAWREAEEHIKATFDTQHLGMWRKHYMPKYLPEKERMETKEETDKRFNGWYMKEVERLHKAGIIGHVHIVDSMGSTHAHLPAGQGMFPVVDAVKYLKEHGFTGTLTSEAFAEDVYKQGRILTATWRAFGSPLYSYGIPPVGRTWPNVQYGYFGRTQPPMFIFGAYAPSNEWQLWSEVPME